MLFRSLDGELVLVGGTLYRVGTDGTPTVVDDDRTTPFFEGIDFHPTASGPVAPGTTCANLGARINEVAGNALRTPQMQERFKQLHGIPMGGTPEDANRYFAEETQRWKTIIAAAGIKPE